MLNIMKELEARLSEPRNRGILNLEVDKHIDPWTSA
jgi:hypothetical protein